MRQLDSRAAGFDLAFATLQATGAPDDLDLQAPVQAILSAVRAQGDEALLDCTRRFDGWTPASANALEIPRTRLDAAMAAITPAQRSALQAAAERVRAYHEEADAS